MSDDPLWIEHAHLKKNALHEKLHIKSGQHIPENRLQKAEHSKSPKLAKEARTAETLKELHRRHGGCV